MERSKVVNGDGCEVCMYVNCGWVTRVWCRKIVVYQGTWTTSEEFLGSWDEVG